MKKNKAESKYLKEVKTFLPIHSHKEKIFIQHIASELEEISNQRPNADYEVFCKELGHPKEIVCGYFEESDIQSLISRLKIRTFLKRIIVITLVIILLTFSLKHIFFYKAYWEIQQLDPPYKMTNDQPSQDIR